MYLQSQAYANNGNVGSNLETVLCHIRVQVHRVICGHLRQGAKTDTVSGTFSIPRLNLSWGCGGIQPPTQDERLGRLVSVTRDIDL